MESIREILELFDTKEKWYAFIELSQKRDALVKELNSRLITELKAIAKESLTDSGWSFESSSGWFYIFPTGDSDIRVIIEPQWWNHEWCRRGVSLWGNHDYLDNYRVVKKLWENKPLLPINEFEETIKNHGWFMFTKSIPSGVFGVESQVTSYEECIFGAKDNPRQLAKNLWEEVFQPFAKKEIADLLKSISQNCKK